MKYTGCTMFNLFFFSNGMSEHFILLESTRNANYEFYFIGYFAWFNKYYMTIVAPEIS